MPLPSTRRQYQDKQVFPYSRDKVFAMVADVDKYSEFVPLCQCSRSFGTTMRSKTMHAKNPENNRIEQIVCRTVQAELEVGYPPFNERYTSIVELQQPWRIVASAVPNGGMFKHMRTVWEFVDNKPTGTLVKFSIDFEFASIVHSHAAGLVFEKIARSTLDAYRSRCRKLYGKL